MGSKLRGRRIAVGVADESLRGTLRKSLEFEAANVRSHSTADALLADVASSAPDLCIVDADLTDLPGPDLVARVHERAAGVPVLVVSAHLDARETGQNSGLPILPLPFTRRQLVDLILRLIGSRD